MKLSALIAPLMAAKAPHDQIMAVVVAYEAEHDDALERAEAYIEDKRAKGRARFHRWKQQQGSNVSKRQQTLATRSKRPARAEDKTLTTVIEPQEDKKRATRDVDAFRAELSEDLDEARIDALVAHRRTKKASLTAHAAKLFRRDAAACSLSLADATDTVISRNWITVKAEWLAGRQQQAPPAPKGGVVMGVLDNLI